jgi:hypothetical protein
MWSEVECHEPPLTLGVIVTSTRSTATAEGCRDNGKYASGPSASLRWRDTDGISKYPTIRRFTLPCSPPKLKSFGGSTSANRHTESRLFSPTATMIARIRESRCYPRCERTSQAHAVPQGLKVRRAGVCATTFTKVCSTSGSGQNVLRAKKNI